MSLFNDKEGLLCLGSLGSVFVSILESFGFEPIGVSVFNHSLCAPSLESTKICSFFSFQLIKEFIPARG